MLIECPECRNEVSSNAQSCPKCGNPMAGGPASPAAVDATKKRGALFYIGWTLAVPVILFFGSAIIAGIADSGKPHHGGPSSDYIASEIERQAELCKNGHMEACETERSLAELKQAAGH